MARVDIVRQVPQTTIAVNSDNKNCFILFKHSATKFSHKVLKNFNANLKSSRTLFYNNQTP